ncbi:MAG TPA: hypothetical protein G4N92_04835 [Anaerolineae bacterium]|nr:hypothetical protein [Anaerolineae bacterium]
MAQLIKQALVTVPGGNLQAHPVRIFPETMVKDLFVALGEDPNFSTKLNINKYRLMTILNNGDTLVFKPTDNLYNNMEDHSTLNLEQLEAPKLGLDVC